jgi:acetoin utilization deacetylase AcuC-like enzyme
MSILKIAWSPFYAHPVPDGHRFPMEKYDLIPKQLMHLGLISAVNLFEPGMIDDSWVEDLHSHEYLNRLKSNSLSRREERVTGFEHTPQLIKREYIIAEGTRVAVDFAIINKIAFNVAGGTHHAFRNKGEGFCLLNDQAIAAKYALNKGLAKRILIIDLDVHQGNGTAEILRDEKDIFTFSMHGKANYPLKKEQSNLDIELEINCGDVEYMSLLYSGLCEVDKVFPEVDFVFYQAGVDVLGSDKLGKLNLSLEGVKARDKAVLDFCEKKNCPVVVTMGGGYSPEIKHILDAHVSLYQEVISRYF